MPRMEGSERTLRLDLVHVGAVVAHRHVDHLDAEVLENREVAVVPGHRTEEPRGSGLPPRAVRPGRAVKPGVQQVQVHQREAAVAAGDHLVGTHAEPRRAQLPGLRQAVEPAVVPDVGPVGGGERPVLRVEVVGERELGRARLAAGQIQGQAGRAEPVVSRGQLPFAGTQGLQVATVEHRRGQVASLLSCYRTAGRRPRCRPAPGRSLLAPQSDPPRPAA